MDVNIDESCAEWLYFDVYSADEDHALRTTEGVQVA